MTTDPIKKPDNKDVNLSSHQKPLLPSIREIIGPKGVRTMVNNIKAFLKKERKK